MSSGLLDSIGRVRMLSTGPGRKTDQADALPVGIAARTAIRLSTAVAGEASRPCAS